MEENIKQVIVEFISEKSKIPQSELQDDTEVYDSNIISSLSLLEMISMIENRYAVVIEPEELIEDNFKYIGTIVGFIRAKLSAKR